MESEEKRFWVGITVFATLFGVGGYIVFEHALWGWIFMVAGLGGLVLGVIEKLGNVRLSSGIWIVAILATWAGIGYDIYDRHHPSFGINPNLAWDDNKPLTRIYPRTFTNETVVLDGKLFINPIFDSVTFVYNGTGPIGVNNATFVKHNGEMRTRIISNNKIVTTIMQMYGTLAAAEGCPVSTTLAAPSTPIEGVPTNK
jgi:hypothetical protein